MSGLLMTVGAVCLLAGIYFFAGLLIPRLPLVRSRARAAKFLGLSFVGMMVFVNAAQALLTPEQREQQRVERERLAAETAEKRPEPAPFVAQEPNAVLAKASQKSGLTKTNYLRISEGMTYREVVGILGEPGEEMSRSDLAGITTVMYMWKRWNGANMNAMFQNDALVTKAQFGLD